MKDIINNAIFMTNTNIVIILIARSYFSLNSTNKNIEHIKLMILNINENKAKKIDKRQEQSKYNS